MNIDSKDEEKDVHKDGINRNLINPLNNDTLSQAFSEICHNSDKEWLNLTDFICGLIQFGIKNLSNKEMENIFNFMDIDKTKTINSTNFIQFLSQTLSPNENESKYKLQLILLNDIKEINNKKNPKQSSIENHRLHATDRKEHLQSDKHRCEDHYDSNLELTQSVFMEYSYIPSRSCFEIYNEYEQQISKLKSQLKEAILTLKETVKMNNVHIGEHQQVITQLKYSLLKQQEKDEATEILIQSSLDETTTDYNPLEWNINDTLDWLQMINLQKYKNIFMQNQINGNKLLNDVYNYNNQQFKEILQFRSQQDIDKFVHEINILKQTAPQIYDPNTVEASPSPSTDTDTDTDYQDDVDDNHEDETDQDDEELQEYVVEQVEYIDDEEDGGYYDNNGGHNTADNDGEQLDVDINLVLNINLEESENVTRHSFLPKRSKTIDVLKDRNIEKQDHHKQEVIELQQTINDQKMMISKQKNELNNIRDREIDKLKNEIQRIELSKMELIISTSNEIQNLRDVIKQYRSQISK